MDDIYLYENSKVLKNLLDIRDEAELDLAETDENESSEKSGKYEKYKTDYVPTKHEYIE